MKFAPSRLKPAELSDKEKLALRGIAQGEPIELLLCQKLRKRGLVEKVQDGWAVTQQGRIRLMFLGAR